MSPTRKPVRVTIAVTAAATPRAAESSAMKTQAYPTAAELLAGSAAWRGWLEQSLRAVLRPVAFAGAVGLAAAAGAGCGRGPSANPEPVAGGQEAVTVGADGSGDPEQALDPKPPEPGSMIAPVPVPAAMAGSQAVVLPMPEPIAVPGGAG